VKQYVLARRDKRFLILFSEGLTREASHHFWMHGTLYKHVNTPQHGSSNQEQPCCGVFLACS
ncbi:MAG: hypothetical protein WBO59_09720, partial [Trichococcus flocculiformis]